MHATDTPMTAIDMSDGTGAGMPDRRIDRMTGAAGNPLSIPLQYVQRDACSDDPINFLPLFLKHSCVKQAFTSIARWY